MKRSHRNSMRLLAAAGALSGIATTAQAELILYEPFDYTVGAALGGSGTSPIGQTNTAYGATWYGRQTGSAYNANNDSTILSGNLSYTGLASSGGNSVSLGRATGSTALSTASIDLPGDPITSGTVYYSMLLQVKNTTPLAGNSPFRFPLASLSQDPSLAAQAGTVPSSYSSTSNKPLPAGLWLRNQAVGGNPVYQFGPGKQNGDGIGNSNGAQGWQSATPQSSQSGTNISGAGQVAPSDTYFVVMKYTFGTTNLIALAGGANSGQNSNQTDTVSIYINPISSTLGDNSGEATAATSTGAYYSAVNTFAGLVDVDATSIQSFFLNGHAMTTQSTTALLSVDELRVGTTWADVTPTGAAPAQTYYWDIDGNAAAGAGGTSPAGVWDGTTQNFSTDSGGASGTLTAAPAAADTVVFAAGSSATGAYAVNVTAPRTVATVRVEEGDVTLAGSAISTGAFEVATNASATVSAPLGGDGDGIVIKSGAGTLTLSSGNNLFGTLHVNGGAVVIDNADALATASVFAETGTARIAPARPKAVMVQNVTASGGQIDLTDNAMVVRDSDLSTVQSLVAGGYNNGTWNGVGINSSTAANDPNFVTAIGYASNGDAFYTEFQGITGLDSNDVLIRVTSLGDSDLNGDTNLDDFPLFTAGLEDDAVGGANVLPSTWFYGDYDYNGVVNLDDFPLFTYGLENDPIQLAALADLIESSTLSAGDKSAMLGMLAAVPEPASFAVLSIAACGLIARRRRQPRERSR